MKIKKDEKIEQELKNFDDHKYREKITNPEALKLLEINSENFKNKVEEFQEILVNFKLPDNISERDKQKEMENLVEYNQKIFSLMLSGSEENKKWSYQEEDFQESGMPRCYNEYNASLYAIGVKKEDISLFLNNQELLKKVIKENLQGEDNHLDKYRIKNGLYSIKDFETGRYRTYYEARRTAENIFTHSTKHEFAQKIIENGNLLSSNLTTDGLSYDELRKRGQIGNIHSEIYFAGNSVAAEYGHDVDERGKYVEKKTDDLVFFVQSGGGLIANGFSPEVSRPDLKDLKDTNRGIGIGKFAEEKNTKIPVDNMFVVITESQKEKYEELLMKNNYNENFIKHNLIIIPGELTKDMAGKFIGNAKNKKIINDFIKSEVKKRNKEENAEDIYATIKSRKSEDIFNPKINK